MLEVDRITKTFRGHKALDAVSFRVPQGTIFGLLGPNGAGKTTLIRIITGIFMPDAGDIRLHGRPIVGMRYHKIGYLPEERGLYRKMRVGEHLMYLAMLKGLTRSEARRNLRYWMKRLEADGWWNRKVEELSKGMQQKVQFIATVVTEPELLILDEPFSGLDPVNTNRIKEEILRLKERGVTIVFSTHRMEQVEEICERIVLIHQGKKILEGGVMEVKNRFKKHLYRIVHGEVFLPTEVTETLDVVEEKPHEVVVRVEGEDVFGVLSTIIAHRIPIRRFEEILPTLNEIFIETVTQKAVTA